MKATDVIEEIKNLGPDEQVQVIRFAIDVARRRQLTPEKLGEQLANATDPVEKARLRSALTRGFSRSAFHRPV